MITIQLIRMSFIDNLSLDSIVKRLTINRDVLSVTIGDAIENIGEPDTGGRAYSDTRLFRLLNTRSKTGVISVGLLLAPIEGNFYTRIDGKGNIIISLFERDEVCKMAGRTIEDSVVLSIVGELLSGQYQALSNTVDYDIFHPSTNGCLFDFVEYKSDMQYKLKHSRINPNCRAKLIDANVPERLVVVTETILKGIREISFLESIRLGISNPIFDLVFGFVCGGLFLNVLTGFLLGDFDSIVDYAVLFALVFAVFGTLMANYLWLRYNSSIRWTPLSRQKNGAG